MQAKCIHKKGDYRIFLAKDNFNGIFIQLAIMKVQKQKKDNGEIKNLGKIPQCIWQTGITTTEKKSIVTGGKINSDNFKKEIAEAIREAKEIIVSACQSEEIIEGTLADYPEAKGV